MTSDTITAALFFAGAFLLGSIPFALLIGLAKGTDIRTVGSNNPGATNLGRHFGFKWFALCFLLDAGKGLAPTLAFGLTQGLTSASGLTPADSLLWLAVMAAPVLGHMYSPWIGFRGGKGVATGLGALLGVYPMLTIPGIGAFVVFVVTLGIWRYVGLASTLAAGSLPLWTWYFFQVLSKGVPDDAARQPPEAWPFVAVSLALAALVIYKHRGNLARIGAGTEPKVGRDGAPNAGDPRPAPSENAGEPVSPPKRDDN